MTNEEAINVLRWLNPPRANKKSFDDFMQVIDMAIEALERQRWIPVTEKLPEEKGSYLTTTMYGNVFCDYWNGLNFDRTEMVIAWMPLPEPYKGGEQK